MRIRFTTPFAVFAAPSRACGRWRRAPVRRTAALASPTNGPDEVASVTNRVHLAQSPETFAYDDDGNQTLIMTKTGLWRVTYNGENRPILWVRDSDNTAIVMSYDYMGRRRAKNAKRFFYDGYLQVADNCGNVYMWDSTESVEAIPLVWNALTTQLSDPTSVFYVHDGNKNVREIIDVSCTIAAHYEYALFGTVIAERGNFVTTNLWRFSSEYADDDLGLVYYNDRHYDTEKGRWLSRDWVENVNAYLICRNPPASSQCNTRCVALCRRCFLA